MIPKVRIRGFEVVTGWEGAGIRLPEQSTAHSAGYDFFLTDDVEIPPNFGSVPFLVPTGVKAYMRAGEYLDLRNRSSNPKKGLLLANGVGTVDSDYYNNPENDGHIMFSFWNVSKGVVSLRKGDKIGQGIFLSYLKADGKETTTKRKGGFGSTDN